MNHKEKATQMVASKNYRNVSNADSTPIEKILGKLEKASKGSGFGCWIARCPAHEDRSPSLSIRELRGGQVLIHCHAGCEPLSVLEAIGLAFEDLFPNKLTNLAIRPERRPFNPMDVLIALRDELIRVYIIGRDMLEWKHTEGNQSRLGLALERIDAGISTTGGSHVK